MKLNHLTICVLALLLLIGFTTQAQVPSPHNFPHVRGYVEGFGNTISTPPTHTSVTMGMSGFVAATSYYSNIGQAYNALFDSIFQPKLTWDASAGPHESYCAVNKDRKVWWATNDGGDLHLSVFSTTGSMYIQLKLTGCTVSDLVADTSGHVYLLYSNGSPGFGLVRFGASFTPDYQKWIAPPGIAGRAEWGIDQRLYVRNNWSITVLDANGDVVKFLQLPPLSFNHYAIHQDHGISTVLASHDTVMVAHMDSSLNVLWSKKFRAPALLASSGWNVSGVDAVAQPGSNDLIVVVTTTQISSSGCSTTFQDYPSQCRTFLFDKNGIHKGQDLVHASGRQLMVQTTPSGDPLVLYQRASCFLPVMEWDLSAAVLPGYNQRANCGAGSALLVYPWAPTSTPTISTATASNVGAPIVADIYPITMHLGRVCRSTRLHLLQALPLDDAHSTTGWRVGGL